MENNTNQNLKTNIKIIAYIVIGLAIIFTAFICYDKFINTEKPPVPNNEEPENTVIIDKITSLNRVEITEEEQIVNVDGKEYKIKKEVTVDGAFLLIDDKIQELFDLGTAYADYAYVTNKYIIFTVIGQDWESIAYAIDKDGHELGVDDSEYQIHNLSIVDGNVEAEGHIFCGVDGDCPDKILIITYENNTITVREKN